METVLTGCKKPCDKGTGKVLVAVAGEDVQLRCLLWLQGVSSAEPDNLRPRAEHVLPYCCCLLQCLKAACWQGPLPFVHLACCSAQTQPCRFIANHNLPASYQQQIVEFVIANTGGSRAAHHTTTNVDPFTGDTSAGHHHAVQHMLSLLACVHLNSMPHICTSRQSLSCCSGCRWCSPLTVTKLVQVVVHMCLAVVGLSRAPGRNPWEQETL